MNPNMCYQSLRLTHPEMTRGELDLPFYRLYQTHKVDSDNLVGREPPR